MRFALTLLLACLLISCTTGPPGLGSGPRCEIAADGALILRGSTDSAMLECVRSKTLPAGGVIVVDSAGGPADIAMTIGDELAKVHAEIVVHGQCNSSCANYFLPIARKITLAPGAIVLLHGSIDEALVAQGAARDVADRQKDFASRHQISGGWLMLRSADDLASGRLGPDLQGTIETWGMPDAHLTAMLVEEELMRSCLAQVEITPFTDTAAQRIRRDGAMRKGLAKQGIYPSGTLRCASSI